MDTIYNRLSFVVKGENWCWQITYLIPSIIHLNIVTIYIDMLVCIVKYCCWNIEVTCESFPYLLFQLKFEAKCPVA